MSPKSREWRRSVFVGWVSFLALCGVPERAVSEGILDSYDLKGGVALELRFAEGARATKDIDIGVPVEPTKRLRVFQDAVALGFDDFTFLLKGSQLNMDKVAAVRLELAIRYRTARGKPSTLIWDRLAGVRWNLWCQLFEDLPRWGCASRHPSDASI
ncbi:hypothetical protein [Tunturiibacter gelidiferens]|uniref:hypothetical protein n=1 Tax=Tunturiibacter gelidiferens TaxID=3069689 RepID=UPI003D9B6926